jgi:transposase-like protein
MNIFKRRHFNNDIIIWAIRWYCKYGISYRDLEEMLEERGLRVDHSTINRWVIFYAPKLAKKLKKYWRPKYSKTWYVDETYIKVKGEMKYLYRAINQEGETIDFYLSPSRNIESAEHFLRKSLKNLKEWQKPKTINTDKDNAYPKAISNLKEKQNLPKSVIHRRVKYLNNRIESDHGKLKRLIKPTLGFKSLETARATIAGFEVMRMFKKGQFRGIHNVMAEVNLVTKSLLAY